MGKYDIDSELTPECRLSLNDLIDELDDELSLYENIDTYKDKFKNSDKSGLIDKLNKLLRFDIEKLSEKSDKEKFDMLKLLKVLFLIEKYGIPKRYSKNRDSKDIRIRIIDILAKPRLSNVNSYLSEASQYGEIIDNLIDYIKSNVDDADIRIKLIEIIDDYWQCIAGQQFYYTFSDMALEYPDIYLNELKRINKALEDILNSIDFDMQMSNLHSDGVLKTFFNILLTHSKLCYDIDRIRVSEYIDINFIPSKEYTRLYLQHESDNINISSLNILRKSITKSEKDDESLLFYNLASYCKGISPDDYKHYNYALDKAPNALRLLQKEKNNADFSSSVPLAILIAVIQEIVYVKKNINKFSIRNDYYGYKAKGMSLLSVLKCDDEPIPLLVDIWIRRIETRFSINYGQNSLIKEKFKAEKQISQIKEYLYSFRQLSDLKDAHDFLLHKVDAIHIKTVEAIIKEQFFRKMVNSTLRNYGINVSFILPKDRDNIYDMFREFMFYYRYNIEEEIDTLAEEVSKYIISMYSHKDVDPNPITHIFTIHYRNEKSRKCFLDFKYDKVKQDFYYIRFGKLYDEDERKRYTRLGLGKFVNEKI